MAVREDLEEVLERLASAPARFAAALSRFEDADSVTGARPGEWSPAEVFAHVRATCDILEPRIFHVLVRDNPPLLAYDEAVWAKVARYAQIPVIESLETMRLRRKELVHALHGLSAEDWARTGTHEVRGPMSVLDIANYIADHEDEHIEQIQLQVER